jgi:hypothetical protein
MEMKEMVWACDPIGSILFVVSATLMLLALDWSGGMYEWHDAHVAAPLAIGLVALLAFAIYGECEAQNASRLSHTYKEIQNGKGATMDLLLMLSLAAVRTLVSPFLLLQSKGKNLWTENIMLLNFGRWIFYSAVNSVTPLIVLNLGFETSAWRISVRQLSFQLVNLLTSIPIMYGSIVLF